MQTLEVYQSLWAMEKRIPDKPEETSETHLQQISEAGYDGACLDPNASEIEDCMQLKPIFEELKLKCMVNAFPDDTQSYKRLLEMSSALNATQVNIIAGIMPLQPEGAVSIIENWLDLAEDYPFPVMFETHRNSTLNDLFYTLTVLSMVPKLRLCADLSHFVIDRELQLPLNNVNTDFFTRIIERSDSFQGRISNNQQIQVALQFEQNKQWVKQFVAWWKEGIDAWSVRNDSNATMRFLVELGPPPYAITDRHQQELSDRWSEGLIIRKWIKDIWEERMTP